VLFRSNKTQAAGFLTVFTRCIPDSATLLVDDYRFYAT